MSTRITVEQIGLVRNGSDIDLEAIFQGHISGRRPHGVKSNPIYNDAHKNNGELNNIQIHTYSNIPHGEISRTLVHLSGKVPNGKSYARPTIQREKNVEVEESEDLVGKHVGSKQEQDENNSSVVDSDISKVTRNLTEQEMQRESLKVTNGEVCVGDIIIEHGIPNPAFDDDRENVRIKDGILSNGINISGKETKNGRNGHIPNGHVSKDLSSPTEDSLCVSLDSKDKADILKDELDQLKDVSTESEVKENVGNHHGDAETDGVTESNASDWPEIDDLSVPRDISEEKDKIPNGKPHLNGHVVNGDSNHVNEIIDSSDINQNIKSSKKSSQKAKTERKSSKKKIKERKNSLPDHILNSLNKKPSKPILIPSTSNGHDPPDTRKDSMVITEQKSVTFSDDTVFNENKPNKYKKERVRKTNDGPMATANPVFVDDDGFEISLTDDEKAMRYFTHQDGSSQLSSDLNVPGYMKEYLIQGGDLPPVMTTKDLIAKPISNGIEEIESIPDENFDRLVHNKTRNYRSRIVRLTLACFAFAVVIGVVVLLVIYFGKPNNLPNPRSTQGV